MRGFIVAALTLTAFNPVSAIASTIIVKPGDTLSEIALRNNIKLKSLLELNRIENINELRVGQKIIIPNRSSSKIRGEATYKVQKGDTLNSIAIRAGISSNKLINLNKLNRNDYIYEGQVLKLKKTSSIEIDSDHLFYIVKSGDTIGELAARYKSSEMAILKENNINNPKNIYPGQKLKIPLKNIPKSDKKASIQSNNKSPQYHILTEGDTLFSISNKYKLTVNEILERNDLSNPNELKIGKKINLIAKINADSNSQKARKKSDWRTYGPLKIDWSKWQRLEGSYVTPTLNRDGKALYLAVNCNAKKLNATGANGTWKNWIEPIEKFEHDLIKDLCIRRKT